MAQLFDFIAGAGIIQGIFIAILLFSGQRGRVPGNRLLAFLLLVLAASTAHPFFGPYLGPLKARAFMIDPMQTLLNPLIWLFVAARCSGLRFRARDFLHFLPFALVCAFLQLSPVFIRDIDGLAIGVSIGYWSLALIQAAAYFFKSYRAIAAYSRALEQSYSKVEAFRLEGLHAFMTIIIVLLAGRLIGLAILAHSESASHADRLMELLQAFAVYFLGVFMALRREPVFAHDAAPQSAIKEEKYGKSALSREEVSSAFARLDARIKEDKLYLDPELSLPALASAWGMNRNDLSRIINEGGGSSFYNFVNKHRISEFQSLAREPLKRSWKILALAFEAGFNSKPAFNSAFKRLTGSTPSSWISSSRSD
jgi:AraC-like DNA-binding protein